jgi:hypothetical protein
LGFQIEKSGKFQVSKTKFDDLVKSLKSLFSVIPAQAGIQCF